jgi:hypothetical protein
MKRKILFYLFILCAFLSLENTNAQTLAAGDIAFIGYNRESSTAEQAFTFITLKAIPAGEVIYFTEKGWNSTTWTGNTERHLSWTTPSTIACGTIIKVAMFVAVPNIFTTTGSTGFVIVGGTALPAFQLSGGGDPILAYQGATVEPANPTFISGIDNNYNSANYNPITKWQNIAPSASNDSTLPLGLTNGVDCVALFPGIVESTCSKYNGTLTGTAAALRASINNYANWSHAALGQSIAPANYPAPNVDCSVATVLPTVTTTGATGVGAVKATLGGNVTADGGATVTERGIVWATTTNPTTANTKVTNGTGLGTFSALISGFPTATTIHFRAYATNSVGTNYGADLTFTTNVALSATTSQTNIACNGGTNGSASVTASGGLAPYTYSWSPSGGTAATASGLSAVAYSCTITDNEGSSIVKNFTITQPALALSATTSKTNILCNGAATGTINLTPNGGTAPYTYNWGGGITTEDRTGLIAGTYNVTVTDSNGCTTTAGATITQPASALSATTSQTNVLCNGATTGTINLTPNGGTSPYTYNWGGGITTEDRTGLIAGIYNVTVTDSNGCTTTAGATITQPASALSATTSQTNVDCTVGSTGSATVIASGGTGSYAYSWTPSGGTAATASGLASGPYTCTITDANGCSIVKNFTITQPLVTVWNGSSWDNGLPTSATAAVISGNYTSAGSINACSLTVNNNAAVAILSGDNVTLNAAVTVDAGSSFTLNNNANLIQSSAASNTGNIVVKRNSASLMRQDYTLWSSPIIGQQLQSFSPITLATRFYTYNPSTNLYVAVTNPAATNFATGTGYLIRMPNDHPATPTIWNGTFTGTPNNGTVNLVVTNGTYNAIGNPYPSTINADTFITSNGITEALYFWRKTNNTVTTSYATYTLAGGVGTGSNSGDPLGLIPNGTIQVGQGFIAKSTAANLTFTNAMRVADNSNQFFRTAADKNRVWLNLTNANGLFSQTMVAYMPNATQGVDAAIDGRFFNDSQTALTSIINTEEFAVQGRALPFDASDVVPLGFKSELAGNYTIALDHFDGLFATNQDIFLRDNQTNTIQDLKAGSYSFATTAGVFNSRFELFYQNALGVNLPSFNENSVVVYKNNGGIHINTGSSTMDNVKIFDISGRLLFEKLKVNTTETILDSSKFANQVLIVQITSDAQIKVSKKVVN